MIRRGPRSGDRGRKITVGLRGELAKWIPLTETHEVFNGEIVEKRIAAGSVAAQVAPRVIPNRTEAVTLGDAFDFTGGQGG